MQIRIEGIERFLHRAQQLPHNGTIRNSQRQGVLAGHESGPFGWKLGDHPDRCVVDREVCVTPEAVGAMEGEVLQKQRVAQPSFTTPRSHLQQRRDADVVAADRDDLGTQRLRRVETLEDRIRHSR